MCILQRAMGKSEETKRHKNVSAVPMTVLLLLASAHLSANNGGVHGPMVKADTSAAELRMNTNNSDDASDGRQQYRAHYQKALSDTLRLRLVLQYRDFGSTEYDNAKAELLYNYKKFEGGKYAAGIRFDVRTRRAQRPEDVAIHWTHQYNFNPKWFARGIAIVGKNVTENGAGKMPSTFASRFSINYKYSKSLMLSAEVYDNYGEIDDIRITGSQKHQFGPAIMYKNKSWYAYARYLKGTSSATPDNNFQFRVGRKF